MTESAMVMQARYGDAGEREVDVLLQRLRIQTVPVTEQHAEIARSAFRQFGKGRQPALESRKFDWRRDIHGLCEPRSRVHGRRTAVQSRRSMKRDLLQKHFQQSGFDAMQSETLAEIFSHFRDEMATKQDLTLLRSELTGEIASLRAELRGDMAALRAETTAGYEAIRTEMASMKADLTWRFVALTVFLATVTALVGAFVN